MASVTCPDWTASAPSPYSPSSPTHRAGLGAGRITRCRRLLHAERLHHHRPAARPAGRTGSLQLVDFWLRRARRLLPALFVMLAVVVGWVALFDRAQLAALRGMVASAALYVSNWWLIAQHSSYFSRFGPPSPLGHLWSLAVEEQFYLVWPWLLLLGPGASRAAAPRVGVTGWPRRPCAGRGVRDGDGAALPPRLRPDPGLRRHRHPGLRAAHRRGAGVRLAQPQAARRHEQGQQLAPGRRGRRRACSSSAC